MTFFYRRATFILLIFVATACLAIQKDSVKVSGYIRDSSGAVISNVELHINPDCKCSDCPDPKECRCCPPQVTVKSDSTGHYEVHLPSGDYTFAVQNTTTKVSVGSQDKNVNIITVK